ncbi:MAG TPA: hypothetical protein VEP90_09640 [Methylomirabilota bacterium]|nr:hypothetical protein [Methylomirabilota bacterium]
MKNVIFAMGLVVGLLLPCVSANADTVSTQWYMKGKDIKGFVLNHMPNVRRVWIDQVVKTRIHNGNQYSVVGNVTDGHRWLMVRDYFGRFQFSVTQSK